MPLKGSFKLLESIRCLLRNVRRFRNYFVFSVDKFSGSLIRSVECQCLQPNDIVVGTSSEKLSTKKTN